MPDEPHLLLFGLAGISLVLVTLLGVGLARARSRLRDLGRRLEEMDALRVKLDRLTEERRFFSWFTREFPRFLRVLHGQLTVRQIPEAIQEFVIRAFDPEEAVVLIRRKRVLSDPDRDKQLIVAASRGKLVNTGTVLPLEAGDLGYVARTRRAMDRRELDRTPSVGDAGNRETLPGFRVELAAPIASGEQVLGVVALAAPRRSRARAKYLVELIAQTGALALSNAVALSQVRSAADTDALTGIYNKGALNFRLGRLLEPAGHQVVELSIFLFDLDHFKNYNDTHGHLAGDRLLQVLASLVAEEVRSDDVFGRFGGEEFLLILPERPAAQAMVVAEKLRRLIEEQDFPLAGTQPLGRVTISGGVASSPVNATAASELIAAADAALYAAKKAGRNRVLRAHGEPRDALAEAHLTPDAAAGEADDDDLELIRGIGPVYRKALRQIGIVSYRQIARLDWTRMVLVASSLGTFPERIVRDRWIQQARDLHFDKYGERL